MVQSVRKTDKSTNMATNLNFLVAKSKIWPAIAAEITKLPRLIATYVPKPFSTNGKCKGTILRETNYKVRR